MTPGVYVLQFDCEDEAGNQAVTQNRTVIVEDTQPPVISLIGPSVIELIAGIPYEDAGAYWNDSSDIMEVRRLPERWILRSRVHIS